MTMRQAIGVFVELVISAAVLGTFVPAGLPFAFYVCNRPVRRHLPRTLSGPLFCGRIIGDRVPGDENCTNYPALVNVSKRRATSICASGKVASVSPATAVAFVATSEPLAYAALERAVAAGGLRGPDEGQTLPQRVAAGQTNELPSVLVSGRSEPARAQK